MVLKSDLVKRKRVTAVSQRPLTAPKTSTEIPVCDDLSPVPSGDLECERTLSPGTRYEEERGVDSDIVSRFTVGVAYSPECEEQTKHW